MHKIVVSIYEYKEKRRRYNKANNPEYLQLRQKHLDAIV
jgi:hypothetical protein